MAGIFSRALRGAGILAASKGASYSVGDAALRSLFGGFGTSSGNIVTNESAMSIVAVNACIRVISQALAVAPVLIHKGEREGVSELDRSHFLFDVLYYRPNRWQTPVEFKQMMTAYALLYGAAYAQIVSTPGKGVSELVPIHPDRVTPFWFKSDDGKYDNIAYRVRLKEDREVIMLYNEIFRISGLSLDPIRPMNPIQIHRESMGLALAQEEHGSRVFSNGAQLGGVLTHPGKLSEAAHKNILDQIKVKYQGTSNAHKTMVLEEGMTFEKVAMTNEDAQYLQSRKFQKTEIATIFGVQAHKINDLEKATFSNIEHLGIEFHQETMLPWFTRWEQAITRDLMGGQKTHFAAFNVDHLLRGDRKTRYEAHKIAREGGWMSANDIRNAENMNPIPKEAGGDEYIRPLNMAAAGDNNSKETKK